MLRSGGTAHFSVDLWLTCFALFLGLQVVMVMVVVVMMMMTGGERRAGKHHQEQGSGKNLLHGTNVARGAALRSNRTGGRIKSGTGRGTALSVQRRA